MMAFSASRPTAFKSSLCPAMPTTRVANTRGTSRHLIMRRKTFETTFRFCDHSGKTSPTATPATIERRIHWVRLIRRMTCHMERIVRREAEKSNRKEEEDILLALSFLVGGSPTQKVG